MIYPADCVGLWTLAQTVVSTLHGSSQTDAKPVMV